jgi:lipooligosaccharide transport system permease protein
VNAFLSLLRPLRFTGHSHIVARRNADVYFLAWKSDFLPPLLEPILYLVALGFGLGQFVPDINGLSYPQFLAPALIAITAMNAAFFECSYGSFVRMYWQKTYDAIISTPVGLDDVILGELLWAAAKAAINGSIVLLVITAFGLVHSPMALLAIPVVMLLGITVGALGILTTSQAPNFDAFNFPLYLYITPMYFLSGTFFPLTNLPAALQFAANTLPLTHATRVIRSLVLDEADASLWGSVLWLAAVGAVLSFLAINAMRNRLIK